MFDKFRSKETLLNKIDKLEAEIKELKAWRDSDWHWLKISFLTNRVSDLESKLKERDQVIQNRNQRIVELQQMLLQLQNENLRSD